MLFDAYPCGVDLVRACPKSWVIYADVSFSKSTSQAVNSITQLRGLLEQYIRNIKPGIGARNRTTNSILDDWFEHQELGFLFSKPRNDFVRLSPLQKSIEEKPPLFQRRSAFLTKLVRNVGIQPFTGFEYRCFSPGCICRRSFQPRVLYDCP